MRVRHVMVLVAICTGYGLVSLYSAYVLLSKSQSHEVNPLLKEMSQAHHRLRSKPAGSQTDPKVQEIDIWDTCGLGIYLWRNVLQGEITRYNLYDGWTQDSLTVDGLLLRYNLGYGLLPEQALKPSQPNIVLIINARSEARLPSAKAWLDHVLKSAYIDQIALMVLGSEYCENSWILPYLQQKRIKCLFLVYDSPLVDDEFVYQWPLGVASYRNFRKFGQEFLDLTAPRKYVFNFVGTVYKSTSRVEMMDAIKEFGNGTKHFIKTRDKWLTEESAENMAIYQHTLLESDLTLSPAGRNSECYRTYEALEMGSIPVIEDVMTEGTCGDYKGDYSEGNYTSPYRLLKRYNAPVIYVKDWREELPEIIKEFRDMRNRVKVHSRINLIHWYVDFKVTMRNKFLGIMKKKFFNGN